MMQVIRLQFSQIQLCTNDCGPIVKMLYLTRYNKNGAFLCMKINFIALNASNTYRDDSGQVHQHHAVQAGPLHGHGDHVRGHCAAASHAVAHAQLHFSVTQTNYIVV